MLDVLEPFSIYFSTFLDCADNMEALCTLCVSSPDFSDYSSVVANTLLCAVVCWGENINAGDADRTNKLVIKAVFVAGLSLNTLEALAHERRRTKLNSILDNPFRPALSILH